MSNITTIYVDNDSVLEVAGLTNDQTGAAINNATVTVQLRTTSGANVDGETWPKAMDYIDGSNGLYRVTLPYTLELAAGGRYVAHVVADAGAGLHAAWSIDCIARDRN